MIIKVFQRIQAQDQRAWEKDQVLPIIMILVIIAILTIIMSLNSFDQGYEKHNRMAKGVWAELALPPSLSLSSWSWLLSLFWSGTWQTPSLSSWSWLSSMILIRDMTNTIEEWPREYEQSLLFHHHCHCHHDHDYCHDHDYNHDCNQLLWSWLLSCSWS